MIVWQTDRLTEWLSDWQTDRLTDFQTDRLTDWQTNRQTFWLTDWQTDRLTDWQTDILTDWQTLRPTVWQTDRLTLSLSFCQFVRPSVCLIKLLSALFLVSSSAFQSDRKIVVHDLWTILLILIDFHFGSWIVLPCKDWLRILQNWFSLGYDSLRSALICQMKW